MRLQLDTGQPVTLGPVLARAGEGAVRGVMERPGWVAKVFHPTLTDLEHKLQKVAAMVHSRPYGATQPNGFVVLTWPLHTLTDSHGPVGYVMPRIDTASAVEIHAMSNPSNRNDPPPGAPQWTKRATWGHLVNVAANLCLAVEVVHRVNAVIGDFQERNILVADTTEVTLVDCDSMQFTGQDGRVFLCRVGRPEFTAPELVGCDLSTQPRAQSSDLFALALHIHLLLMAGNHPFQRGTWTGPDDQPGALELARSGHWAGGPGSPLHSHPLAPPITFLPDEIQHLFTRVFSDGAHKPHERPSAAEWRAALSRMQLRSCGRGSHQIPVTCRHCPWCAIDDERQKRKVRQSSGPQKVLPRNSTGSQSVVRPDAVVPAPLLPASSGQKASAGINTQAILIGLAVTVVIVATLAIFIVWALLSGTTSFGA